MRELGAGRRGSFSELFPLLVGMGNKSVRTGNWLGGESIFPISTSFLDQVLGESYFQHSWDTDAASPNCINQ